VRRAAWVILIAILAAGCSHKGDRSAKRERPDFPPADAVRQPAPPKAKPRPATPKPKPQPPPQQSKPHSSRHRPPWRPNGMSTVAHVESRVVRVYAYPRAKQPELVLQRRDERGTQRAFLVRKQTKKWLRVYLPSRPNGSLGWVRRRAVRLYTNPYRLVVRLSRHKLQLWRGQKLVAGYPVAAGTSSTPTPHGMFYVVELLKPHNPNGSYGPYSFGISAHSDVLKTFAGGDGRVGLHGTNQPDLIGGDVSHGCIRLRNAPIRRLAKILPLGTPVYVRA
jgi:lipoprotein-anchoring transpeptidase ErfK/SrfK